MEGSGYVDIFATKGIEYLMVIGFLMMLVVFWRALSRSPRIAVAQVHGARPAGPQAWFDLAEGLFYHQGHTWAAPEEDGVVRVGLDDFAQKLLGVAQSVHVPGVGSTVEQGEKGIRFFVNSKSIEVLSPVGGEVLAINEAVLRSPGLINEDPYGKGWLFKVRVPRLSANLRNLLSGRLARVWMDGTVRLLKRRMEGDLGPVLQDGGVPVIGIAKDLSPDQWEDIAADFLHTR
jgi:glycine cleavage system H lipoate-binding protein